MTTMPLRLALAACLLALAGGAMAEDRAVVIANRDYDRLPDVAEIHTEGAVVALRRQGYRVTEGRDLTADGIRAALRVLLSGDADPGARIVVLMGRFVRTEDESWFLGREAGRESLSTVDAAAVPLSVAAELMDGGRGPAVLLLGSISLRRMLLFRHCLSATKKRLMALSSMPSVRAPIIQQASI